MVQCRHMCSLKNILCPSRTSNQGCDMWVKGSQDCVTILIWVGNTYPVIIWSSYVQFFFPSSIHNTWLHNTECGFHCSIEIFLLIVCGSVPTLKPVYDRIFDPQRTRMPYSTSEGNCRVRDRPPQKQSEGITKINSFGGSTTVCEVDREEYDFPLPPNVECWKKELYV